MYFMERMKRGRTENKRLEKGNEYFRFINRRSTRVRDEEIINTGSSLEIEVEKNEEKEWRKETRKKRKVK
jgi:hypothetical protein